MSIFSKIAKYIPVPESQEHPPAEMTPSEALASLQYSLGDMWWADRVKLGIILRDVVARIERLEQRIGQ